MSEAMATRLWDPGGAFDHPVTVGVCVAVVIGLIAALAVVDLLDRMGRLTPEVRRELHARIKSWAVIVPLIAAPILISATAVIAAVAVLAILCYREFARATGLFRHRSVSATVAAGIFVVFFAAADHWYGLLVASWPLAISLIAFVALWRDRPQGYIQRVALGIFAFALFGMGLGHLGYLANDALFRPMLVWLLLCVEANDIFAYCWGKAVGCHKLAPNTSPNKTIGGAAGALLTTTALTAFVGHFVFRGTAIDSAVHLIALGVIISVLGQAGDLVLSSIKRDLRIKDMSAAIPGHGGLLDRFDSLLLVAPAVFHYIGYFKPDGIGLDAPVRLFSG